MSLSDLPRIIYPGEVDERYAYEITMKGWTYVHVEAEQGIYYKLSFYDIVTLRQDVEFDFERGEPCFTDYGGLVILPEVTIEAIEKAVLFLWRKNYFKYWKPEELKT